MGKFLLLLLVALALGLYFPESREMIAEHSRPLLTPAYRWMTNQQLGQIVQDLQVLEGSGGALPTQRGQFDLWLDRRYPQEGSRRDAWGSRYRLEIEIHQFRVVSAGPDGVFGTEDDLFRVGVRGIGSEAP
jgi:hypothetical protein